MQGNKSPEIREVLRLSVGCDVVITVKQWLVPGRIPWERTKVCSQSELSIHFFVNLNYFVPISVTY